VSVGSLTHGGLGRAAGGGSRAGARDGPMPSSALAAIAALTAAGAALRFYGIGHQGYWFDEGNTVLLVHLSPGKMLGLLPQSESTPPLYYCVAWVWARVFGFGEAGLRSLSALAGVLVIPVSYGAASRLISRPAGIVAAALTAFNPLLIWYSQEARSYSLLVLLTGVSLLCFAYARAQPSRRRLGAWALFCALSLATHYYAVVAIVPQAAWLLREHRRERRVWAAVGAVGLCGLALIPLAISQNDTGRDSWIAHAPLAPRLRQIIPQFLIGTDAPARTALKFAAFVLAVAALALLAWRAGPRERRGALLAGGLAAGGLLLALALVVAGFDDLITRNIIALWLPAALLIAGGLALERARPAGIAVAAALCAIGATAAVGVAADRSFQRPDWRYVARELGARPSGEAGRAILIQHYRTLLPLSLYLPGLRFMGRRPARVDELDIVSISSPQQPLCWWGAACNLIPSQIQATYAIPGFHELWRRRVLQFTIVRLVSERPVTLTRSEVSAALRTTELRHDGLIVQP
jgi:mannosyltransferase